MIKVQSNRMTGYALALLTVCIWATTYIFTKRLLREFTAFEILFFRFSLAYITLLLIYPKFQFSLRLKEEILFLGLGLFGVTAYYLLENIALQYTQASNVGLIVSSIPIFTAIIAHFTQKDEAFHANLLYGFIFSIFGIFLVVFNGRYILRLSPTGDLLALACALIFALYSNLLKKVAPGLERILIVRKIFFYGLVTMAPLMFIQDLHFPLNRMWDIDILGSLLFLSILASILASIMWYNAIKLIGATKTTSFIYLVPLITMISSFIFLQEKINGLMIAGGILILFGVYLSERKRKKQGSLDVDQPV